MRILDRYIGRTFAEPFLVATAAIVGLYIVGDAFSNLDDYLRETGGLWQALSSMVEIYVKRVPTFLAPVLPIAVLVGAAYGIGHLSGHNELSAMQVCGLSLWRIVTPVYVLAAMISLLGFANRELLVFRIEEALAPKIATLQGKGHRYEQVTLYIEEEDTFYTVTYNPTTRDATSMLITDKAIGTVLYAQQAEEVEDGWLLTDVWVDGEMVASREWKTRLRRRDLDLALLEPSVCPIGMLRRLIQSQPDIPELRLYYHGRLAYPFTGLVLVGLGLPFALRSERMQRSRILGVGICIVICMVFYAAEFVSRDLGLSGALPPGLAAWLPTVMFGAAGVYLLETVGT